MVRLSSGAQSTGSNTDFLFMLVDYCLAHFLQGVLLHYLYRPDPQVKAEPFEPSMSAEEADKAMVEVRSTSLWARVETNDLRTYSH